MQRRGFEPIGIEGLYWELMGIDDGRVAPHTSAHTRVNISAREIARFGYLMLHGGVWNGTPLVPSWWLDLATRPSQAHNRCYGLAWWVNREGDWEGVPRDAFAAMGAHHNVCYIIPSLDLVALRIGAGPEGSVTEPTFIAAVVRSIVG